MRMQIILANQYLYPSTSVDKKRFVSLSLLITESAWIGVATCQFVLHIHLNVLFFSSSSFDFKGWWTPMFFTAGITSAKYFYRHVCRRNTVAASRKNIAGHYDLVWIIKLSSIWQCSFLLISRLFLKLSKDAYKFVLDFLYWYNELAATQFSLLSLSSRR